MTAVALAKDMKIDVEGRAFFIRSRVPDGPYFLEALNDGDILRLSHDQIAKGIVEGRIRLPAAPLEPGLEKIRRRLDEDLSGLSLDEKAEMRRRLAYVRAVEKRLCPTHTRRQLEPVIADTAEAVCDKQPPSAATLSRWLRYFREGGGDPRALVPSIRDRGNRTRRLPPEVLQILDEAIRQRYLTMEKPGARAVHDQILCRITDINKHLPPEHRLPVPSLRAIYREIERIAPYELAKARDGKRLADIEFRVAGKTIEPTRPLERVEIDHTKLDLFVVDDEHRLPLGRAWLTMAIDVFSRMPVGLHIGFEEPSWRSVMHCLRQLVAPKDYIAERYPEIDGKWDCYGIPEVIVVDNGMEFHSLDFEESCAALGAQVQYTARKSPWLKGSVERWFGTLNAQLLHGQPGTTFSSIFLRKDYQPAKNAVISLSVLKECLHRWIIEVYARSYHRGLRDIPGDRWREGLKRYPVRLPADLRDLNVMICSTMTRTLFHYGIQLFDLTYNSEELGALRRSLGNKLKLQVRYDPSDLGRIWVVHPKTLQLIEVPVNERMRDYATGLGLWQHKVIKRYVRVHFKCKIDIVALARAREQIRSRIAEELPRKRQAQRGRQRMARYLDQQAMPKPEQPITPVEIVFPEDDPPPPELTHWKDEPDDDDDDWEVDYELPG